MTTLADLLALLAVPATLLPASLALRAAGQADRDTRRHVYRLGFPRDLSERQCAAFLAALSGLATPRLTLLGRDAAVFEVVARDGRVEHFLRLPSASWHFYVGRLRGAVPGIEVTEVAAGHLPRLTDAQELRRVGTDHPLAVPDPSATAATVLLAASGAGRGQLAVWQWVVAGGSPFHASASWGELIGRAVTGKGAPRPRRSGDALVSATLRIAVASGTTRAPERLARLRRAASSVSVPGGRLVPRAVPGWLAARRVLRGATPAASAPTPVSAAELVALLGWPLQSASVPGLTLGRSPQLAPSREVPRTGLVLGDSTAEPVRPVAIGTKAARTHLLLTGPTGSGKTWLAAGLALQQIAAGRGCTIIDPKGGLVDAVLRRLPEQATGRVILLDPTDETRPVPLPLLARESGGYAERSADTLIALLRHRYSDIGPRSSDVLASSLYSLARTPNASFLDLLRLWSDARFRADVAGRVGGDPALASFWSWSAGISEAERAAALAPLLNKVRPLLQRSVVCNVLAAPRATFSFAGALASDAVVLVNLPEGTLGREASGLIGQVVLARLWAAVQARRERRSHLVLIDEAHRFLDTPTDLGDVLALSREYGVGYALLTQSVQQFPERLRDVVMNSARTKVAFQTAARDASRLASEFGPLVSSQMLAGLGEWQAMAQVATGGSVSEPFTLRTRPLGDALSGRRASVQAASRARYGVPRGEIEASFRMPAPSPDVPPQDRADDSDTAGELGPLGRRPKS